MREMRGKTIRIFLFILFLTSFLSAGQQKVNPKDLPEKYREWLKLTRYIILEEERDVFLQLKSDRERDIFIEAFWKQRDPTPGTPENEFKKEHIKRFVYANEHFSRTSSREGYLTDRGEIYIILGPPISISRYPSTKGLYPCEVWSYYGDEEKGIPPHFSLVFFQRGGAGEYELYNPTADGPSTLLTHRYQFDVYNYKKWYDKLREIAPTVAQVSLSLVPGDIPFNFQPSTHNATILKNILEMPEKSVNPTYSTNFLKYKGIVSTEYLTNYVESESKISITHDPVLGVQFVNFSIVPQNISINYYEPNDQYYCNFTVSVSLRKNEKIIFQYTKDFPFYFPPEDVDRVEGNGISIEDSFPVIEGKYKLNILLQNSVGREFSVAEKEILVPEHSGDPQIFGPLLGYRFHQYEKNQHVPFKLLEKKLLVDPKDTFSSTDPVAVLFSISPLNKDLWEEGEVRVSIESFKKEKDFVKSFSLKLKDYPYEKNLCIDHSFAAGELPPDYYEMELNFVDKNGESLDKERAQFVVYSTESVSHPIANTKISSLSNKYLYFYMLASQYDKVKDYEKAERLFERAYRLKPEYRKGLVSYLNFLVKTKKYSKSLKMIENIKGEKNLKFDYYLIKGQSQMGLGQYEKAIKNLLEGNKIYNSDTRLLNSLGICYYRTNQNSKALEALQASLQMNPNQKGVEQLIQEINQKQN